MACDDCHAVGDQRTHSRQACSYQRTAGFNGAPDVDAEAVVGQVCQTPIRCEDLMNADDRGCAYTINISKVTRRFPRVLMSSLQPAEKENACQRNLDSCANMQSPDHRNGQQEKQKV